MHRRAHFRLGLFVLFACIVMNCLPVATVAFAQPEVVPSHGMRFSISLQIDGEPVERSDIIACMADPKHPALFRKSPHPSFVVHRLKKGGALIIPVSPFICVQWHSHWTTPDLLAKAHPPMREAVPTPRYLPLILRTDSLEQPTEVIVYASERSLTGPGSRVHVRFARIEPLPYPLAPEAYGAALLSEKQLPPLDQFFSSRVEDMLRWLGCSFDPRPRNIWRLDVEMATYLSTYAGTNKFVILPEALRPALIRLPHPRPQNFMPAGIIQTGVVRQGKDPGLLDTPHALPAHPEAAAQRDRIDRVIPVRCRPKQCTGTSGDRGFRIRRTQRRAA